MPAAPVVQDADPELTLDNVLEVLIDGQFERRAAGWWRSILLNARLLASVCTSTVPGRPLMKRVVAASMPLSPLLSIPCTPSTCAARSLFGVTAGFPS